MKHSTKRILKLAEDFTKAAQQFSDNQPGTVEQDFFPFETVRGENQLNFMNLINSRDSAFQKAIANVQGNITVEISTNADIESCDFVVSPNNKKIKDALIQDYKSLFGSEPIAVYLNKFKRPVANGKSTLLEI